MADPDERDPATDDSDNAATEEKSTGADLLPDADPEQTGGAKYAKDEKVNYAEDMLP